MPEPIRNDKKLAPIEYRTFDITRLKVETREEGEPGTIIGHAAVFNSISDSGGWFREQVAPGAFKDSIKQDDIRALFNHDPNHVLGRNTAGTLSLKEDEKGLLVEINPPDTQIARDVKESIRRGDINQMSFGFEILKETRTAGEGKEPDLYTLDEVRLWDVSPVTYPFYKETDVSIKSRQAWHEEQKKTALPVGKRRDLTRKVLEYKYRKANKK